MVWTTRYQDSQGLESVEVETADVQFGPAGFSDNVRIHDISLRYTVNDDFVLYGGINNLDDEEPFITETGWPVNPEGRTFFFGVNYKM